jgi:hypothetical protein
MPGVFLPQSPTRPGMRVRRFTYSEVAMGWDVWAMGYCYGICADPQNVK